MIFLKNEIKGRVFVFINLYLVWGITMVYNMDIF